MSRKKSRIVVQQNSPTEGPAGDIVDNWTEYCTRWADVQGVRGSESVDPAQRVAERLISFVVREDSVTNGIKESMRVQYSGSAYDITSVDTFPNRRVEIQAIKVVL